MDLTKYEYKPTTALKKISKLVNSVDDLAIIQGGGGAGKTIGILMLIIDWFNRNPDKQITICSHERTKLMDTAFLDFKKILIDYGLWYVGKWNENKSRFVFHHGKTGFIEFIGLDKEGIGKGRRRDLIYINEGNKITEDKYIDVSLRAKKVIVDFNADFEFWAHEYVKDDNFISLTFEDNEFIPEEEKRNLLEYREKGFHDPEAPDLFNSKNIKNKKYSNLWKIYGMGLMGGLSGQILTNWTRGEYVQTEATCYGTDWGHTHPMAVVKVSVDHAKKKIYVKKIVYKKGLSSSTQIKAITNNMHHNDVNACDSAYPSMVGDLRMLNYNAIGIKKPPGSVAQGLMWMMDYLIVVEDFPELEYELKHYLWADEKSNTPIDKDNDAIDAMRYAYRWIRLNILRLHQ